jgi:hypothetical protein
MILKKLGTHFFLIAQYLLDDQCSILFPNFLSKFLSCLIILYGTLKILDKGHLRPKLEFPGLTCPSPESNPGL